MGCLTIFVEKQPVAWQVCCVVYWCWKTRKRMNRWTGRRDMTEQLLKTALNPNTSINQLINQSLSMSASLILNSNEPTLTWAVPRENQQYGLCVTYRPRSACAGQSGPTHSVSGVYSHDSRNRKSTGGENCFFFWLACTTCLGWSGPILYAESRVGFSRATAAKMRL